MNLSSSYQIKIPQPLTADVHEFLVDFEFALNRLSISHTMSYSALNDACAFSAKSVSYLVELLMAVVRPDLEALERAQTNSVDAYGLNPGMRALAAIQKGAFTLEDMNLFATYARDALGRSRMAIDAVQSYAAEAAKLDLDQPATAQFQKIVQTMRDNAQEAQAIIQAMTTTIADLQEQRAQIDRAVRSARSEADVAGEPEPDRRPAPLPPPLTARPPAPQPANPDLGAAQRLSLAINSRIPR